MNKFHDLTNEELAIAATAIRQMLDSHPDANGGAAAAWNAMPGSWLSNSARLYRELSDEIWRRGEEEGAPGSKKWAAERLAQMA